nr:glycosyltransferase family A protein [Hyphomonas sp. Mor2]
MDSRVSVILPTFNRADLITDTLDSLLAQTRAPDEILIIDDGSTDDTAARIASFGEKVRYHRTENGGKSAALNLAMTMIEGDFVWICDDDDLVLPDACESLMQELEADPELDFCAGLHEDFFVDEASGEIVRKEPGYSKASRPDEIFSDALDGCHIFQPGLIVRRAFYERIGAFDETLKRSQDYHMLLRLARHGAGRVVPHVVFLHREHQGTRGYGGERFAMKDANRKWIKYHRQIIKPLLDELPDEEVLPTDIWNDPKQKTKRSRAALIRRGSVLGRHVLWDEALETWANIDPSANEPLSDYEIKRIRMSTSYGLGCAPLLESEEVQQKVKDLKASSPLGRKIIGELGRSVRWRAKRAAMGGRISDLVQLVRFMMMTR